MQYVVGVCGCQTLHTPPFLNLGIQHSSSVWTGCNWIAAIQTHGDKKYTILRVEGLANPGKTTWSTRNYGRFGATRTVKVQKGKPLVLDQYYVIANGERDTTWCQAQATMLRTRR